MSIKSRVKDLANQKHVTVAEIERKLDLGNGTITKWDRRSPSTNSLKKVADYFNVSTDYLLGREAPANKEVDLADKDALLMYQGKPVSDEDKEMILRLMRGKEED